MSVTSDPKRSVALMTHVKEGVSLDAVNAELQAITQRLAVRSPNNYPKAGFRMKVQTLNDFLLQRFGGTLKVRTIESGSTSVLSRNVARIAWSHMRWRSGRMNLASAWPWAPSAATCCDS